MDEAPHVTIANRQMIREGFAPSGRWFMEYAFTLHYCRCPACGAPEQPTLDDAIHIEKDDGRAQCQPIGRRGDWICDDCLRTFPRGALIPEGSHLIMPFDDEA